MLCWYYIPLPLMKPPHNSNLYSYNVFCPLTRVLPWSHKSTKPKPLLSCGPAMIFDNFSHHLSSRETSKSTPSLNTLFPPTQVSFTASSLNPLPSFIPQISASITIQSAHFPTSIAPTFSSNPHPYPAFLVNPRIACSMLSFSSGYHPLSPEGLIPVAGLRRVMAL